MIRSTGSAPCRACCALADGESRCGIVRECEGIKWVIRCVAHEKLKISRSVKCMSLGAGSNCREWDCTHRSSYHILSLSVKDLSFMSSFCHVIFPLLYSSLPHSSLFWANSLLPSSSDLVFVFCDPSIFSYSYSVLSIAPLLYSYQSGVAFPTTIVNGVTDSWAQTNLYGLQNPGQSSRSFVQLIRICL